MSEVSKGTNTTRKNYNTFWIQAGLWIRQSVGAKKISRMGRYPGTRDWDKKLHCINRLHVRKHTRNRDFVETLETAAGITRETTAKPRENKVKVNAYRFESGFSTIGESAFGLMCPNGLGCLASVWEVLVHFSKSRRKVENEQNRTSNHGQKMRRSVSFL